MKFYILLLGLMLSALNAQEQPKTTQDEQNILELDFAMMGIYDEAQKGFKENFLKEHPVIVAFFNITGGEMTLYLPNKEPIQGPPVPVLYDLLKSVSHSTLAVFEIVDSHLKNVGDLTWKPGMQAFREKCLTALKSLESLSIDDRLKENMRQTLNANIAFMDDCLKNGTFSQTEIQAWTNIVRPSLIQNIEAAARIQVAHWMKVIYDWKKMIGSDWDKTYALATTVYMLRQNNVLYSILAQFFGKEALNTRLFLFETTDFKTTQEQMLKLLMRTVADRSIGQAVFGNYYLMDNDITGPDARTAIHEEGKKLGLQVFLPPIVPFHSTEWPWRIDPNQGEGASTLKELR